jgi:hypothetical protein
MLPRSPHLLGTWRCDSIELLTHVAPNRQKNTYGSYRRLDVDNRKVTSRRACHLRLLPEGEKNEEANNWFPVPLSAST